MPLSERMTAAELAAGGSTMDVTAGTASLTGTFSFGPHAGGAMLYPSRGSGRLIAAGHQVDYVLDVVKLPDNFNFYVNDGSVINDRHWARVPGVVDELDDVKALLKTHPWFVAIPQLVQDSQPDILAGYLFGAGPSLQSIGAETVNGVNVTHYRFTVDGTKPEAGAKSTFEIWIDQQGRPAKYISNDRGFPMTATYGHWGKPPLLSLPPTADVSVLPATPL
jgi:hypothetical protein